MKCKADWVRPMVLLIALTLGACQPRPQPLSVGQRLDLGLAGTGAAPAFFFHTPQGEVGIILTQAGEVYEPIGDTPEEIVYVTLDGTWKTLQLERKFDCNHRIIYNAFTRLADGRLALRGHCTHIGPQQAATYLLAYDESRQTTSLLVPGMLPIDDSLSFAWNPDVTRAIVSFGTLFSGLYWIDVAGNAEPVTATIQAYGKSFSLETAYVGFNQDGVANTGNATRPTWSPDGSTIAFFASTDAINRQGISRISGRWILCLMDVQTLEPKVVLEDIYWLGDIQWSSDGRFIVFYGQIGARGPKGVWAYSVATGETRFIAEASEGTFIEFILAQDDHTMYALHYVDEEMRELGAWQYDLRQALSASSDAGP